MVMMTHDNLHQAHLQLLAMVKIEEQLEFLALPVCRGTECLVQPLLVDKREAEARLEQC